MRHSPMAHPYTARGEGIGAASRSLVCAVLSVICAILWPLTILTMFLINVDHSISGSASPVQPEFAYFLLSCGFLLLPVVAIVAGAIGFFGALRQPAVRHSRWLALTGMLLGCVWLVATFVLSDAGPALLYWRWHL